MKNAAFFFLALLLAAPWQRAEAIGRMQTADGSMELARWAGNSQGQISSGTNSGTGYSLYTSIGEAAFSRASAGDFIANPGYIKLAGQPGSVISITAVTKDTDTLTLSWNAPGADGFLGNVIGGVYRIYYSSRSAQADSFLPTSPAVVEIPEFSTSVVANTPQQYTLTGLAPNTTYYTKIYLGDAGKVIAEKSVKSAESTLADLPVNPIVSSVTACNVTISWLLPPTGAAGFGIFSPGSDIRIVSTPDGQQANLLVNDLSPSTTYFFRVASLNWQGDKNFTALITAITSTGTCLPQISLTSTIGYPRRERAITLTWVNPSTTSLQGVVVMLSTSSTPASLNGTEYLGQTLADGSVVKSTGSAATLRDTTGLTTSLALDTTYFYHLLAKYDGPMYSVAVSTSVFLDLPPMAPAGLIAELNPGHTAVELNWQPVKSSLDGTPFHSTSTSSIMPEELSHYRIEKSSSVGAPNWITLTDSLTIDASSFTAVVASTDPFYIYRISAIDSFNTEDAAMAVDTNHNVYVFSDDQVARLKIPPAISDEMLLANNEPGTNILIRATHIKGPYTGPDAADIMNAVSYDAVRTPGDEPLPNFKFSRPELTVSVSYKVDNSGQVVPSAAGPQAISAGDAAQRLGLYWNNGEKYVKFYGNVDIINQLVSAQTAMTGQYQVRAVYRDAGVHFDISQWSNRAITPNGDGLNDIAVIVFDNPNDSAYSGKIYDISGAFVANMTEGPAVKKSLKWDGKAGGRPVASGAYVYQIKSEGKTFNGTLLVIR